MVNMIPAFLRWMILFQISLLVSSSLLAQPDLRNSRIYGGDRAEMCWDHTLTADEGYALIGESVNSANGETQMVLMKVNADGDLEWSELYGGELDDWGTALLQTEDGGYVLTGHTRSYGAGNFDVWLIKVDEQGAQEWMQTYGGDHYDGCYSILPEADGGYTLAGYTWSFGAGEKDFYLIRTDAEGEPIWTRTFGGEDFDYARTHIKTNDGGYVLGGYTVSYGHGEKDAGFCKADEDGELVWWQAYGGEQNDEVYDLIQTSDGGLAVVGYTESFGDGGWDGYLIKTAANGEEEWSRTYGGEETELFTDVHQLMDGGYLLTGYSNSFGAGMMDYYVIRTDPRGEPLWTTTYGGAEGDQCLSALITPEGYSLAGGTLSEREGHLDFWLVETELDPVIEFSIPLQRGWNLISTPVAPVRPNMETVWGEIVDRDNLQLVKNYLGQFYSPEQNFHNLGPWNVHQGYLADLERADTLWFLNQPLPPRTPLPIPAGWSMVSYLPEESVSAPEAFSGLAENLIICKDGIGRFYVPAWNFSNLGNLSRGHGYQVNVIEEADLIWTVPQD